VKAFAVSNAKALGRVQRQKGMAWLPVGTQDPALRERAEQLRELLNEAYVNDFCGRCGLIFHTAVAQIGTTDDESAPVPPTPSQVGK
jgi:hypothetical protein